MQVVMKWFVWKALAVCGMVAISAPAQVVVDALERPVRMTVRAPHSVLLDITQAGNRMVAVGERGIVVFSDDEGATWRQGKVPVSESLTAVTFVNPKMGWAVGHAGVVLHTEDGGETWVRQLDGKTAAQTALQAAQSFASNHPGSPEGQRLLDAAKLLVDDGADKPFLAVYFENEQTGFVAGAYGILFRTQDGGRSWASWMDRIDNPKSLHINAMKASGDNIYLAGERGLFLRSSDNGNRFTRIETPYKGSYFTIILSQSGDVVLAGMQGNVYRSGDQGKTFTKVAVPIPATIGISTKLRDNTLVFVNQAGQVLLSGDEGRTVHVLTAPPLPPSAAVLQGTHNMWSVGVAGVVPFSMSEPTLANAGMQ